MKLNGKARAHKGDVNVGRFGSLRYRTSRSGFTLVEVIISSALMALILTTAYLCLSAAISSQKLIEPRADVIQNARVALALVSADLRGACTLSQDSEFVGMNRSIGEMAADNLDFATHNYTPKHAHEGDYCQLSYFVEQDPATGQYSLWRRRNPTIGLDPLSGGNREEIAKGVAGFKLEYYDGFEWYSTWGDVDGKGKAKDKKQSSVLDVSNLSGMPEAVRITLSFAVSPAVKSAAKPKSEQPEPPLVFQTVARLNLATSSQSSSAGSSSSTSPSDASGNSTPQTGGGGQ